jgi:hypothetical protein
MLESRKFVHHEDVLDLCIRGPDQFLTSDLPQLPILRLAGQF